MNKNKLLLIFSIFIFFLIIFYPHIKTPSLNRNWSEESKILPDITIEENTISVKNIRDWRYEKDKVISKNYFDDEFDLNKIKKTYLLFNPFSDWEAIGHFFFVFEFEDNKTVSVSIEARREKDEEYKFVKGMMNNYELWYAYGSIEDFLGRRAIYQDQELYMYPLLISEEYSKLLFADLAMVTEKLETEPRFYNTISSNCTNLLADSANRIKKGSIPYHYSRILVGYADNQLYDLNLISNDDTYENIYKKSRIDNHIKEFDGEDGLWNFIILHE
jgi:hypothetical protein